ncbi:MAG: RnfABCDGE type electron transport complex subunit D [Clostridia bacterium]|nr:RnfABCDGE type electron transport complex subunit D [Clostridia bacterium]
MENLMTVSSSPHIRTNETTGSIMRDVLIALVPALFCSIVFFGLRSLYIVAITVGACVGFEYLWQKITKKPVTISDGTAAVTGVLLAMNVPVTAPWWMMVIGSFVAIIIAKQLYGGVGHNFVNPALAGRAFLLASWPVLMTRWGMPFSTGFSISTDLVSSATPLAILKGTQEGQLPSFIDMFIGNMGGCLGETSASALILGGAYLVIRKVISPRIPLCFIGTVAALSFIFSNGDLSAAQSVLYNILSGGLMLGAIFMATDYVTSPITAKGQVIMGIGCGVITFVIRKFGGYPEGVSYAILIMNIATPLIDKYCRPKKFGAVKKEAV